MTALQPSDQRRAALSAGLLASNHDGEVVAAARALCGLLKKCGVDAADAVSAGLAALAARTVPSLPPLAASQSHWWSVAQFCACHLDQLNQIEHQFVIDMAHRNTRPSVKQEAWLARIGSDSPTFALYENGAIIQQTANGFRTTLARLERSEHYHARGFLQHLRPVLETRRSPVISCEKEGEGGNRNWRKEMGSEHPLSVPS